MSEYKSLDKSEKQLYIYYELKIETLKINK